MHANVKCRWYQFRLRSFFVVIALFALGLSWWNHSRYCRERAEIHLKFAEALDNGLDANPASFHSRIAHEYRRAKWLPWERLWIDESWPAKSARWSVFLPGPGSDVSFQKGEITLTNRPHISRTDWSGGTLSFEWKPENFAESAEHRISYCDHLLIVLSGTGAVQPLGANEPADGIVIRIHAGGGAVAVELAGGLGQESAVLFQGKIPGKAGAPAIDSNEWHPVAITDDGKTLVVSLDGNEIAKTTIPLAARKGNVYSLCNREAVGYTHTSRIRRFQVSNLP